jgi:hypothetical protein
LQRGPVDNDIGFSDGDVMTSNSKSNVISPSLSDSFVNRDASIRSHCRDLQPDTMSSESSALASTPAVIKDPKAVVGVGLGVRPNADGSYSVSGIIPYSSAELCEKIQVGDIVHSVDGVPVCGKPYETVRDLVQGPYGTQVMIAFLKPKATSENLLQVNFGAQNNSREHCILNLFSFRCRG